MDTTAEQTEKVRAWVEGVAFDEKSQAQVANLANMPFISGHIAVMPDVHYGKGATIGSVIPTIGAIIPAAVGVDIGCGMMAVKTSLAADDLPDHLYDIRSAIEKRVPHGRTLGRNRRDRGAWGQIPDHIGDFWSPLVGRFERLAEKYSVLEKANHVNHLGTLGTGNHFIELCLDESNQVWAMLHSGSRGIGNRIGNYFIEKAKEEMLRLDAHLPDHDLAYLQEGSKLFDDYVEAVEWAQDFALANRKAMMRATLEAIASVIPRPFEWRVEAVNCHHNYIAKETHFGKSSWITRKGAVRAGLGELGIIPGSMGAKSFIVRGLGNEQSYCSCSHGAGRIMSRTQAKQQITLSQHLNDVSGVECRKDSEVIDESPRAYKPIEAVMHAQRDLVEIVHTLKQVVCVKG